jgi:hypothetical protein
MSQCLYMDESAPFGYRPELARQVQPALRGMIEAAHAWAAGEPAAGEPAAGAPASDVRGRG